MTWRDDLQPASFKGVSFEVLTDSQPAGQRTQVHEYPQRDKPQVEPLGLRTDEIKVTAFVQGADCLQKRDALVKVINEPGAGELIHPWRGSLTVSVTDCTYSHSRLAKGVVQFDITFVAGESEPDYPVAGKNAAAALNAAADGVQTSAIGRFVEALDGIDLSQLRFTSVSGALGQIATSVSDVYGSAGGLFDSAEGLFNRVVAGPAAFAASVFAVIGGAQRVFSGFYSRAQGVASLFGLGDRVSVIRSVGSVTSSSGAMGNTFVRAVGGLLQDAIATDVVRSLGELPTTAAAQPVAGSVALDVLSDEAVPAGMASAEDVVSQLLATPAVQPPVSDDVLTLRDDVAESFWDLAATAPADHYERVAVARQAATQHLTAVARQGVRLTQINNISPVPALVLAYRRYADASRATDIVARNRVRHPGFVPAEILQVPRV